LTRSLVNWGTQPSEAKKTLHIFDLKQIFFRF
jgi:hypothetical protein